MSDRVQVPGTPEGDEELADYNTVGDPNLERQRLTTWFEDLDRAVIDADRCVQCGACVAACPTDSIGVGEDGLPSLVKLCIGCGRCWDSCPRGGLRYERQWTITGGEDNVSGAGDPITEFSAKVAEDWHEDAQDGGVVTSVLLHLLESGEIDGALIATESEDAVWKAESYLATTPEQLIANAGSFYNQTMALADLDLERWAHKLPDEPWAELDLALVGTPCEIQTIRALQDAESGFGSDFGEHEAGVRAVEYTIALLCTKNFDHGRLIVEQLSEQRDVDPREIGKLDVIHGELLVDDLDGDRVLAEDIENFHEAALTGCDECADFTGYCADLAVGSVGSSDEYSSVIVRTEEGMRAWELTAPDLDFHDLENRSEIGGLQSWDKKAAFDALQRPFDPEAPLTIEYPEHLEHYDEE